MPDPSGRLGFRHLNCQRWEFRHAVIGMEPTGHYWKALANFLMKQKNIMVVLVNPYATKRAKELDDNSPTKSDKKDSLTIARLVKDGRYFETYLPHDVYADLRVLSTTRQGLNKRKSAIRNTITAIMDEYFPEFTNVFKHPLKGKASRHLMKTLPFPGFILNAGEQYGSRGERQARAILDQVGALYAGGDLSEEDMDAFNRALQEAYWEAKAINQKFTPKKYRKPKAE